MGYRPNHFPKRLAVLAIVFLGAATLGCNRGGPDRYGVSGTVTHAGKPVPAGVVVFDPDAAKGNAGPQGFALIHDGHFDTNGKAGKGSVGGPHRIRVLGYDGLDRNETSPYGNRLFREHVLENDLPKGSANLDINVSATP